MTKEFVCIVCPSSCRLTVTEEDGRITVRGHTCKRGEAHGLSEYQNPVRMLTSTMAVQNGTLPRLPVIGTAEVPKAKLRECLAQIYQTAVAAPVCCGDVLIQNICGTGADIVAARSMKAKNN